MGRESPATISSASTALFWLIRIWASETSMFGSPSSVAIASRRGEITSKVKVVDSTAPGTVFMSFHYSESPVNVLTNSESCPTCKIPELKVTAVNIRKV